MQSFGYNSDRMVYIRITFLEEKCISVSALKKMYIRINQRK